MEYVGKDPSFGGIMEYKKKNDSLKLGAATLDQIIYSFWNGKFFGVQLTTSGSTNWNGLKEAVFEKFVKGFQANKNIERYGWFGDITSMALEYNEIKASWILIMASEEIHKQQQLWSERKAREGAREGF